MIGETVSHYKILEKLGEGGMGVVYKAQDTTLDRFVALKFLPSHLSSSPQDKARFIREAKSASAMNHPNICTIYSIDEHEGQLFIAMEFVEGQTLREKTNSQITNLKSAIDIGIQIADGLAAAHEKGIVHRDIKPENIMIRKDGIAQIMDFGLAKFRASGSKISRLTKQGSTIGTAGYMSPEQVQGLDADHRSDIFSLGVLLYELFAGQLPFRGVHETALMYEIVNVNPASMTSFKPDLNPELDRIVLSCLEKDPNERTQSAKQVSLELKRFSRESGRTNTSRITSAHQVALPQARKTTGSPFQRFVWPLAAGILLLALGFSLFSLWQRGNERTQIVRLCIVPPSNQELDLRVFGSLAISPDGTLIVFRTNNMLYLRDLASFESKAIPETEGGAGPFFSPDGRWLAFFTPDGLKKVPVRGGASVVVANAPGNRGATWALDGSIIYTPQGRGGLVRVKEDGKNVSALTVVDSTKNERTHRWPQALPDGKTVLYTRGTMDSPDYYEDATIMALNMEKGESKEVLKGASTAQYIHNGYLLYSHSGTVFAAPFDLGTIAITGSPIPVIDKVSSDPSTGAAHYVCSENGTLVYVGGGGTVQKGLLATAGMNGEKVVLPMAPQNFVDPALSPDGNRIAVGIQTGKEVDIYICDIRRNTQRRFTFDKSSRSPVWSPDGKRIAYSNNAGKGTIFIKDADGGAAPESFEIPTDRTYVSSWARDGSALIITVPEPGMRWDIWIQPLTGDRKARRFLSTKTDEGAASLSPNGKWLAYISNETGRNHVYVRSFPEGEGKWQVSTNPIPVSPRWSSDGNTLYYMDENDIIGVSIEGSYSLTFSQPKIVVKDISRLDTESQVNFDVASGGQPFLVPVSEADSRSPKEINVVLNWFDEIERLVPTGK